jgi:hypothetical protein
VINQDIEPAIIRESACRGKNMASERSGKTSSALIGTVGRCLALREEIGRMISGGFVEVKRAATLLFGPIHGRIGVLQ